MQPNLGRPKDLIKRERILQAAKSLFLQCGYDGCSMNKIAAVAGVSKLTVYNHFQDKDSLFVCAIESACAEHINPQQLHLHTEANFAEHLRYVCAQLLYMCYLPEAIKLDQLMLQLTAQQQPLLQRFFHASHGTTQRMLCGFMQQALDFAFIQNCTAQQATDVLMSLLCGTPHLHVLLGMRAVPSAAERDVIMNRTLQIFLTQYAT